MTGNTRNYFLVICQVEILNAIDRDWLQKIGPLLNASLMENTCPSVQPVLLSHIQSDSERRNLCFPLFRLESYNYPNFRHRRMNNHGKDGCDFIAISSKKNGALIILLKSTLL